MLRIMSVHIAGDLHILHTILYFSVGACFEKYDMFQMGPHVEFTVVKQVHTKIKIHSTKSLTLHKAMCGSTDLSNKRSYYATVEMKT